MPAADTNPPSLPHQPRDTLAAMLLATRLQISMNARCPIGLSRGHVDGPDPFQQSRVGNSVSQRRTENPGIVAGLRYVEDARHDGNGEPGLVCAHEPEEHDGTVLVSRANQAAALRDVALHPELLVLTPQPGQLVPLGRCQTRDHLFPSALLLVSHSHPCAD